MQKIILAIFLLSLGVNVVLTAFDPSLWIIPAILVGWYAADFLSGVIHMYMDYRPCPPGKRLSDLFFYEGSRESEEYLAMFRERMSAINPFERLVYDFKNHHPRPLALGRRDLWRLIGSTVIVAALPLSLGLNAASLFVTVPGWFMAACCAFLTGGAFAQYFHGSLHREKNPWIVTALRRIGFLMTPAAHQKHHDTLKCDFSTNCGWSNPVVNQIFRIARARGLLDDSGLVPGA